MTYPVVEGITSDIVVSGKLSSLQLEGVVYAVCIFLITINKLVFLLCNSDKGQGHILLLLRLNFLIFYT